MTDKEFKRLLEGNYIGFRRASGVVIPSDPAERIEKSQGLQGAYMVLVQGKSKPEAARIVGLTRQAISAITNQLIDEYLASEGELTVTIKIPGSKRDALDKFLDKVGGSEI